MARSIKDVITHIRAVAADPSIDTTLIQTEDLLALCDAAERSPDNPVDAREKFYRFLDRVIGPRTG